MNPSTSSRPGILLVEDDPGLAGMLVRFLVDLVEGYDLGVVCAAAEVFPYLRSRSVSLVIIDFSLLGMTGLQFTAAIKVSANKLRVTFGCRNCGSIGEMDDLRR